ncbi:MAG: type 1 glutamine amidotransferase domain-containing protein [Xanthomonadaceae bacterium]|nr:type 1 glutamine amidotransferase domain-containing protein [Xanthomonadaceae bacterium]
MITWMKRILLSGVLLALALTGTGLLFWHSLDLDAEPAANRQARADELGFAERRPVRGRVLAVVTSTDRLANGKRTGYELTELSRAWWVFVHNGYAVDIASPAGGEPPMVLDDDLIDADYAFLADPAAQQALRHSIALAEVDPGRYDAVYFVGGKGTMLDFPGNPDIARIVRDLAPRGVIGAVCHGPAALLGITLDDGRSVLGGRRVTGFSNAEELFLAEDALARMGFLLEDALRAEAGAFAEGPMYLDHSIVDGHLVTGQNPWSTWSVAESMVQALGNTPVARSLTAEEHSVRLLAIYRRDGLPAALAARSQGPRADKRLLLLHSLIAAMQWQAVDAYRLLRLAHG